VPQAEALDQLLKKKHIKLDAVIELRVNESALLQRVETRVAEMRARGEDVRIDDTPEVLTKRLASYRAQTEPLIHYYSERRKLLTVDGMMTIEHVTHEIYRILSAIGAVEAEASKKKASRTKAVKKATVPKRSAKVAKKVTKKATKKAAKSAGKAPRKTAKAARVAKPVKKAPKVAKKPAKKAKKTTRRAASGSKARVATKSGKGARRSRKGEPRHSDG